ncbi:MAG: hypothetical protein Q9221_004456 [Calogaya cf. arnoldii]
MSTSLWTAANVNVKAEDEDDLIGDDGAQCLISTMVTTGVESSVTKQSAKSSKRSKRSHDTTRTARSKQLGREREVAPSQQSHCSSIVSDKICNASTAAHNKNAKPVPRLANVRAVYIPYDPDWERDGRKIVLYICRQMIKDGEVVYLLKDKPCNHPEAKTVYESMPEAELDKVPENVEIRQDGTAAVPE